VNKTSVRPVRGRRAGGPFGQGLYFKNVYISKDLGNAIISLNRTYFVNFKLDCKPKELLQEMQYNPDHPSPD
jgi:hypothetical protein